MRKVDVQGGAPDRWLSWFIALITVLFVGDISIILLWFFMGFLEPLITGGHHLVRGVYIKTMAGDHVPDE